MTLPFEEFTPRRHAADVFEAAVHRSRTRRRTTRTAAGILGLLVFIGCLFMLLNSRIPAEPVEFEVRKVWSGKKDAAFTLIPQNDGAMVIFIHSTLEENS
ncbi:MAG TPA: hypothetical protein PK014_05930 [Thermoanaerobaculia bacterium]|nr:hypothetical protein [Thermoanaerobaculia bacterium]HUM29635.1 hypothetical protein [Thermoanaerobaculia bacterium]HXK67286.1 hypothetical protein [Thermoanaerobaculia bacterium]